MWIVITNAFIDKQAEDPKDAEVPAGKRMNVTAERGQELIDLGLAEAGDTDAPKSKPRTRRAKATADEPAIEPSQPARDDSGNIPIPLGDPEQIDGQKAAVEISHD